jgi:sugar phosphate isomerase/epimerase
MFLSIVLRSFGTDFATSLRQGAELGFTHVDIVAEVERSEADRDALADSGLTVACAALGRGLPEGQALDAVAIEPRRAALAAMKRQLDDAALAGATHAYLVPGSDRSEAALARFRDAVALLAEHAAGRKVRLCVEHFPGKALPTVRETLAFIDSVKHANLYLLLDVGHCLISKEHDAEVIRRAGARLGYVHFNDNDGERDLHLPLLQGKWTEEGLRSVVTCLTALVKYDGALSLELNPENPLPHDGIRASRAVLGRLLGQKAGR